MSRPNATALIGGMWRPSDVYIRACMHLRELLDTTTAVVHWYEFLSCSYWWSCGRHTRFCKGEIAQILPCFGRLARLSAPCERVVCLRQLASHCSCTCSG